MGLDEEDGFDLTESDAAVEMETESEEEQVNVQQSVVPFHKRWTMKLCLPILMVSRGVHVALNRRNQGIQSEHLDSGNLSTKSLDRYTIENIGEQKS